MSKNLAAPAQSGADLQRQWSWGMPDDESAEGEQMSADEAGYLPPSDGPFMCSNCAYFVADKQPCQKVSDPVEKDGCCDNFAPRGSGAGAPQPQADSESAEGTVPQQSGSY